MAEIIVDRVLPDFFTVVEHRSSGVWGKRVVFEKGKCYAVSAASGKGKSTLLNYMFGIRQIPNGDVQLNGRSVAAWSPEERSAMRSNTISMVFQDLQLFGHLTARENIELKRIRTNEPTTDAIAAWASVLEVEELLDRRCDRLSLGQQQRIAILRALAQPFEWLLMDEPTSHLDAHNAARVMQLVREECVRKGAGCLVSTLDEKPFFDVDDTVYC